MSANKGIGICPNCGHRLPDAPTLKAGPFAYGETRGFLVNGQRLEITGAGHKLLGAIMSAGGAVVDDAALLQAMGSIVEEGSTVVRAQLSYAKKAFFCLGQNWPIDTQRGVGRYWSGPKVTRQG